MSDDHIPRSKEAEQSILAGCLMGCRTDLAPSDFYYTEHKLIFKVVAWHWKNGIEPDIVLVGDQLKKAKKLKHAGGIDYLTRLTVDLPLTTQSAVDRYSTIVRDKSLLRDIIIMGRELQKRAIDQESPVDLMGQLYSQLAKIGDSRSDGFYDYDQLITDTVERIEIRKNSPQPITGVETPWTGLNNLTNGFQPNDLIIIAGRPGMGKSAMASQLADHAALVDGPTLVFSLEMSKEQWGDRTISREARVDSREIRTGFISDKDMARIEKSKEWLVKLPLRLDDTPGLSVDQILLASRKAKARMGGLSMIVIDYLQLMRSTSKDRRRDEELGEITRMFKLCAKELNSPVVLLAQLNRKPEDRDDKRPMLSDLRESGNIEQDADVVIFLYRDDYYFKDSENKGKVEVIVAKQRNGPTGRLHLVWQEKFTRFENLARSEPDDERGPEETNAPPSTGKPDPKGEQMPLGLSDESGNKAGEDRSANGSG